MTPSAHRTKTAYYAWCHNCGIPIRDAKEVERRRFAFGARETLRGEATVFIGVLCKPCSRAEKWGVVAERGDAWAFWVRG